MIFTSSGRAHVALVGATSVLIAALLVQGHERPAHAAVGLPRGYDIQLIENPDPDIGDQFGDAFWNAGDIDGDGEDDLIVGIDEHGAIEGFVYIFNGADGSLIREIPLPDAPAGGRAFAWGNYISKIPDLGSCAGGANGETCPAAVVGAPDGVDDHLIGAGGADIAGEDAGAAYVVDGATGAVIKRILMPPADRAEQAAVPTSAKGGDPRSGFGATVLVPRGQAPCEGNMGVGPCDLGPAAPGASPGPFPAAVKVGDVDGAGAPDLVVAARSYHDTPGSNPACPDDPCFQSGRVYVYRGEDVVGSDPNDVLEDPLYTVKNRLAQWDDPDSSPRYFREAFGYSLSPLGDVGSCTNPQKQAGDYCLGSNMSTTPDGLPDFVASVHRADMFGMGDVGAAFVIDGPTGTIINVLTHPEPQPSAIFGYSRVNQPAIGDAGSSTLPDAFLGAMVQNTHGLRAAGAGYVVNADAKFGGANHATISVFYDPTPAAIGNLGSVSMGVGDLTGDPHKEAMVGAAGPHAPQVREDVVNDVHIFSPLSSEPLQSIASPSQQLGAGFGRAMTPLGDLNDDGFLDFAVGEGLYDTEVGTNIGRLYIFRSNNDTPTEAGRSVDVTLKWHLVAKGTVSTSSGVRDCVAGVPVVIKRNGERIAKMTTDGDGNFKKKLPDRRGRYRAVAKKVTRDGVVCARAAAGARHRH